jgi:hypothetical protein
MAMINKMSTLTEKAPLTFVRKSASFYDRGEAIMSTIEDIKIRVKNIRPGKPFTTNRFIGMGSRAAVDKALSRLVKAKKIKRVTRGVFVRPLQNRFVGEVMPEVPQVIEAMAHEHGEKIQLHGAEAARRFRLSTQMPTQLVYYTSGSSRVVHVGKLNVRLIHTSNSKKLAYGGTNVGLALSALWYLGKNQITNESISKIRSNLSFQDFTTLCEASKPEWMTKAIQDYCHE